VKKMAGPSIKIEPLFKEKEIRVGETIELRVKVVDAATNQPKTDLKDVGVLTFLAPGTGQQRMWAESVGEGIYKVSFTAPQPGAYYVFFQVPSLKVRYNQLPHQVLQAAGEPTAARGVSNR